MPTGMAELAFFRGSSGPGRSRRPVAYIVAELTSLAQWSRSKQLPPIDTASQPRHVSARGLPLTSSPPRSRAQGMPGA